MVDIIAVLILLLITMLGSALSGAAYGAIVNALTWRRSKYFDLRSGVLAGIRFGAVFGALNAVVALVLSYLVVVLALPNVPFVVYILSGLLVWAGCTARVPGLNGGFSFASSVIAAIGGVFCGISALLFLFAVMSLFN